MSTANQASLDSVLRAALRDEPGAAQQARERLGAGEKPSENSIHSVWNGLFKDTVQRDNVELTTQQRDKFELMVSLGKPPAELVDLNSKRLARDMAGADPRALHSLDLFANLGIKMAPEHSGPAMNTLLCRAVRDNDAEALSVYKRAAEHGMSATSEGQARAWNTAFQNMRNEDPDTKRQLQLLETLGAKPDPKSETAQWAMRCALHDLGHCYLPAEKALSTLQSVGVQMDPAGAQKAADNAVRAIGSQQPDSVRAAGILVDAGARPSHGVVGSAMRALVRDGLDGDLHAQMNLGAVVGFGVRPDQAAARSITDKIRDAIENHTSQESPAHRIANIISGFGAKLEAVQEKIMARVPSLSALFPKNDDAARPVRRLHA